MEIFGLIISLFALALGLFNSVGVKKFQKTQHELNSIILSNEVESLKDNQKAQCCVTLVKIGKGYILKIYNKGKATGNTVNAVFSKNDDKSLHIHNLSSMFPISSIKPQEAVESSAYLTFGKKEPWTYRITWENPDGSLGEDAGDLRVPLH